MIIVSFVPVEIPPLVTTVDVDEDMDEPGVLLTGAMCFSCPCELGVGRRPRVQVKCCRVLRTIYQDEPRSSEYI